MGSVSSIKRRHGGVGSRVAAVALLTVAGTMVADAAARAQPAETAPEQSERTIVFAIPAQDLNSALLAFARAAGVQVFFDPEMVAGLRSGGLNGGFTPSRGLDSLLAGTGIGSRVTGPNTITLIAPPPAGDSALRLAPVTVAGQAPLPSQAEIGALPPAYAGRQVARGAKLGMLGNRDVMDTPFSVVSYTSDLIQNQEARTVADVLENDSSVRFTTPGGHVQENYTIRGFSFDSNELAINGMYGMAPNGHVPVEFLERVELIKGPNALLSGMAPGGGVGGSINLVPKRAGDTPVTTITADYVSPGQGGTHVDVGRRFGPDGLVGIRVNGAFRDGETGVSGQSKERNLASLALDLRDDRLRLSLDAYAMRELFDGGSPLNASFASSLTSVPDAPDSDTNIFKGIHGKQENYAAIARGEYDILDNLTAYAAAGFRDNSYVGFITSTHAIDTTASGSFNLRTTNQDGFNNTQSIEGGLRGHFDTGAVSHQTVISATRLNTESGMQFTRTSYTTSNLYAPISPTLASTPTRPLKTGESTLGSVAIADTLGFIDDRILVTVGGRHQMINSRAFNTNTGILTSNYTKSALSPAMGVVVKPFEIPLSIYANYIEGLSEGSRVTDTLASNYGTVFAPYKAKQREIGVKWDGGAIASTLGAFKIEKPTLSSNSSTHVYSVSEQTNQGVEWTMFGEPTAGVRILGGVTYMTSELRGTAGGRYDGKQAWGVPNWQSNIGLEWDAPFAPGLTLESRVVYTGSQYVNSANTLKIPEWTRLDLGARYSLPVRATTLTIRGYVTNVMDESYWAGVFSDGYVTISAPRTFMLSTSVDF